MVFREILQETLMRRLPLEEFARNGVGRGRVHGEELAYPAEVIDCFFVRHRYDRNTESRADSVGDRLRRDTWLGDGVHRRPGRGSLECKSHETGGVEAVDGGPTVRSVSDVARKALLACDRDQGGDESMVTVAMDRRRESYARRSDTFFSERQREVHVGRSRMETGLRLIGLGRDASGGEAEDSSGDNERSVAVLEDRSNRFDGVSVGQGGLFHT